MPAMNMPLEGQAVGDVEDTSKGQAVIQFPWSGPTGSPLDAQSYDPTTGTLTGDATNYSTGALSTGIGYGANRIMSSITETGFTDSVTPGVTNPDGTAATTAILMAIGGGSSAAASNGIAETTPLLVQGIGNFGNGVLRDAGTASPYTDYAAKLVTATGNVSNGGVIEAGYINATGVNMVSGQSAFGISTTASAGIVPVISGDLTPAVSAPNKPVYTYTSVPTGVVWSIVGGADSALFTINATSGALAFVNPSVTNSYEVIIQAANGSFTTTATINVTVS